MFEERPAIDHAKVHMAIVGKAPVGQVLLLTHCFIVSTLFLPKLQIKRTFIRLPLTLYNLNKAMS